MIFKNILLWAIVGGICLLLITPLIVSSTLFFPFITGKAFFFRIVVEIITGLWLILMLVDKNARPKSSPLLWSVLILGVVASLAAYLGVNPMRSFWSNFERMEGLIGLWHILALFVVTGSVVIKREYWRLIVWSSLVVSTLISSYALVQLLGWATINQGGVRVDATFGNATYLAVYLLFNLFLIFVLLTKVWVAHVWQRYILGILMVLQLVVLYHTATRGVILGLIGGLLLSGILIAWQYPGRSRQWMIVALVTLMLLIGGFILARDTALIKNSPVLARFASISATEATTQSRLIIWQMSLKGVVERPLFGWGQENYGAVFDKYYDPRLWRQEAWFDRSHNVLLDWLVATGPIGLLAYLSLFAGGLWLLWRRLSFADWLGSPVAKSLTTGLLAAYFFQNLFVFDNLMSYCYFFLLLAYLHQASIKNNQETNPKNSITITPLVWGTVAVVVMIVGSVIYLVNIAPLATASGLIKAMRGNSQPLENLVWFQKVIDYQSPLGDRELREQLLNRAEAVVRDERLSVEQRQAFAGYAFKEMEQIVTRNPEDARLLLLAGNFLSHFNQFDLAATYLERARQSSPTKQLILFSIASNYAAKKDYIKAEAAVRQAYELDPTYLEARKFYGLILLMNGKIQAARDLLIPEYGTIAVPDPQYINWFAQTRQYNLVLESWQKLAPTNPNNVQYQFSLAAAYLAVGRRTEAITTIEQIIAKFPNHEKQGRELIDDIRAGRNILGQ
ncbi:MAG: O-antigen ligase family protein [Candidatus Vogelbacteria bacterium]|nr:O-antigen ligase family protein [Candidatus Vogelbacteria bacterium]